MKIVFWKIPNKKKYFFTNPEIHKGPRIIVVKAKQSVTLKQEKPLKFHVVIQPLSNMENYWDQASGHAQPAHPVKFER